MIATLPELFAAGRPDDGATVFMDVPGAEKVTYADVDRESSRFAHALVASGVRPGDRVGVQVEKSPAMILLYLAVVRCGAAVLPMNPAYTDDEVAYLIDDAEPGVLVHDPSRSAPAEFGGAALTLDSNGAGSLVELAGTQPNGFEDVPVGPDDMAGVLYTSGTTGKPKGAVLSQRNLASNAAALHRVWGFRPDDVLLHALPIFHTHGLFVATNCVLANGTGMVFLPRFDVGAVLSELPRCTVFMGVPTFYTRLLADARLGADVCRSMRVFISGSAPLLAPTHEEFRVRTGHVILERYGMTETSMITSNPLDGERRPGTVGFPLPGVDLRVIGEPVGGIEVRGPNVFSGYWKRPELSASEFTAGGFFRTGDLGTIDADGYLQIVGRSKDLIISGGLNVYPKEVEEVLDALPGIDESAVVGLPDTDLGEAVVAAVVPQPGVVVDGDALRQAVRTKVAAFKVPKRVVVVESLPRNAMGKVEKAKLRALLVGG